MTLNEKIDELMALKRQYGGDINVVQESTNQEHNNDLIDCEHSTAVLAFKSEKDFRDMFDGEYYTKLVYLLVNKKDKDTEYIIKL